MGPIHMNNNDRFLKVWHRKVQDPTGKVIDWDVCGHNSTEYPTFAITFPFFTQSKETQLILEYSQGTNQLIHTFASGAFDRLKHGSIVECAKAELAEEMHLTGGQWVPLLPDGHEGISELKWGTNKFFPFLVIDPVADDNPPALDHEEFIIQQKKISIDSLHQMTVEGKLMLPAVQTAYMALDKLRRLGLIQQL
ncbi:hypothetical protein MIR68_006833 [Amoeboaphelidium protococcarum]|nr:hypothetical protein MIR68_006833 [Amoeboaphelidium protococcarum]